MDEQYGLRSQVLLLPFSLTGEQRVNCRKILLLSLVRGELEFLQQQSSHFLHPEEQQMLQKYPYHKRQHSFLLGRYAAKQGISYFLNRDPRSFSVRQGLLGEPILEPHAALLSISHSDNVGVSLIGDCLIQTGIDIELKINFQKNSHYFSKCPIVERLQAAAAWELEICQGVVWTARESLGKYFRLGLLIPSDYFNDCDYWFEEGFCLLKHRKFPLIKTTIFNLKTIIIAITCSTRIEFYQSALTKISSLAILQ